MCFISCLEWLFIAYHKNHKFSDTRKIAVITLKLEQYRFIRVTGPKIADRMANSVDPDQTATLIWVYIVYLGLCVQ